MRASSSASVVVPRTPTGQFIPGVGGNPRGRPPAKYDLPAACREHSPEALQRLLQIIRGDDDDRALRAIQLLWERGHGRPMQPIADSTEAGVSLQLMHLVATQQVAEQLEREWSARKTNGSGHEPEPPVIDYSQPALE